MGRLIDADEVIAALDARIVDPHDKDRAISAVGYIPTAQPKMGEWIPCKEKLPEKEKATYWVCTDAGCQCECRWTNNRYGFIELDEWGWSIFDTPKYSKVIAWQPLPEPYKEEEDGND